jgi:hypothetical protein
MLIRSLVLAVLVLFVAGCSAPDRPSDAETQKKQQQAKFRKAKARYAAFLDEAIKGTDLLASRPEPDKLQDQIKRLDQLLDQAADVYPDHPKLAAAERDCKGVIRFFTASLTNIKGRLVGRENVSEETKDGVYGACKTNASAARETAESVRDRLGIASQPAGAK